MPPVALKLIEAFCPEQFGVITFTVSTMDDVGTVIVTCVDFVHPLESVAEIVYVPEVLTE